MEREFLKTPQSPPKPEPSPQGKLSSSPQTQDGGEVPATAEEAMGVEMPTVEDVSIRGYRAIVMRRTRSTDGRAELPSLNDASDQNTKAETPSKDPIGKGKEKEKVVDTDDGTMNTSPDVTFFLPPRPPPRRPGWGRDPREEILHTVPRSHAGHHRQRAVFRRWPRDPNGKPLMPSEKPRGTLSPDGYPWGATLYDLYCISHQFGRTSIMTGSALRNTMKKLGELDVAGPEIEWAKSEGKPRVEGVANTEELIERIERKLQTSQKAYYKSSKLDDVPGTALPNRIDRQGGVEEASEDKKYDEEHNKEDVVEQAPEDDSGDGGDNNDDDDDDDDMKADPASIPPLPTIPVTSPFHPSHYPKPWPFIPFENPLSILLQERIPLYLLPQTLYVHDPFNLLPAREQSFRDTSWTSRPDFIRTYNLSLSKFLHRGVEEARRKAEELEEFKSRTLVILRYTRTKEQIKNHEPVIEVPLPPYPRRMTKVEESHLYLSPVAKAGEGHHSIVYRAEWELPRELFTRPKLCGQCFKESVDKEIQRLKDKGRWKEMLRAAAPDPTGFTGRQPTPAELDETSDPIDHKRDGEIIERKITCIVPPNASPSQILQMVDERNAWDMLKKQSNANAIQLNFTEDEDEGESSEGSHVTTIRIDPPFSYESQNTCTHGPPHFAVPRTAKFSVVVKLSIADDDHLAWEAHNYQRFPDRFFNHYNGYACIAELATIVPVNAIVPQFYGYYTPKEDTKEYQEKEPYLSPILLLEHCGEPIEPEKLSNEDQDECASLWLRFQRAGWVHESVALRNFVVQRGKPTEFPDERQRNPQPSFRLIDFGRSGMYRYESDSWGEMAQTLCLFWNLNGKRSGLKSAT